MAQSISTNHVDIVGLAPSDVVGQDDNEEPEQDTRRGRKWDPEVLIMADMARTLEGLDTKARARIVAWLSSRYQD